MKEAEMAQIADLIDRVIMHSEDSAMHTSVRNEVKELTSKFPLYNGLF
jgi:glycine hydroxymethyltransferase